MTVIGERDGDTGANIVRSEAHGAEIGVQHRIGGPQWASYAMEMAGREDNRRVSDGEQFLLATGAALAHLIGRQ